MLPVKFNYFFIFWLGFLFPRLLVKRFLLSFTIQPKTTGTVLCCYIASSLLSDAAFSTPLYISLCNFLRIRYPGALLLRYSFFIFGGSAFEYTN